MADLRFDSIDHAYWHGARRLASVTEILSAVGLTKNLDFLQLDDSYRHKGAAVHSACRLVDEGRLDAEGTHADILPYAEAYAAFKRDTGFVGHAWEVPMADVKLGIAGTLDALGEAGGQTWLLDFKTGTCPPTVGAQLAGYEHLLTNGEVIGEDEFGIMKRTPDAPGWYLPLHRKSLNLVGTKYVLKSHDEPRWPTIWRAAVTLYNARKEYGLLNG